MIPTKEQIAEWRAEIAAASLLFRLGQMAMHQHRIACVVASDDWLAAKALLPTFGMTTAVETITSERFPTVADIGKLTEAFERFGKTLSATEDALVRLEATLRDQKKS